LQGVELGSGNVDCRFDAGVTASVNLTVQEVSATSGTAVVTGNFSFPSPGMFSLITCGSPPYDFSPPYLKECH
jgi:hypothetical protein